MFYQNGLNFECQRCSACCRLEPGYVFFSQKDLNKMASYLNISNEEFLKKYTRTIQIGEFSRVSLIEKPNYDCIFWTEKGCEIYPVRPLQCKSYPFWPAIVSDKESWDNEGKSCPGINKGRRRSKKEIEKWLMERERESFL